MAFRLGVSAYYNEHDPFAAAWLRELIADNLIAPGEVDERSIEDVTPDDLRSFRQCHFFAGIGVWSLAARRSGIPDDAPLWSGSCPCQPFSAAGKGGGFDDERHLWPSFHYLIEQCGPALVVGEQVTGADGDTWLDLVQSDMEATAYAFGAVETVACGFGAPHKRSRNYWMAYRLGARLEGFAGHGDDRDQPGWIGALPPRPASAGGDAVGLADFTSGGRGKERADAGGLAVGDSAQRRSAGPSDGRGALGMANDDSYGQRAPGEARRDEPERHAQSGRSIRIERPGPVNGLWRNADWLFSRDERWRPVEPGTFPLADAGSVRNRVGVLRGAGNACTLGQAEGFLKAVMASI